MEDMSMVFSSMVFLWIFLPAILAAYFICPGKGRNLLLVLFSLVFYAWGEPVYILLMLFSVIINFVSGICLERFPDRKKIILAVCILANLSLLGYFKYFNFAVRLINRLFSAAGISLLSAREIALPVGISFYTFQALSYVIDVYRGEVKSQRNFLHMLLYISFFPQLIAGPIVKYHDIEEQISSRVVTADKFASGVCRFICGLGKKVILSNTFAVYVDSIHGCDFGQVSSASLWMAALFYMLQIYFDFSGYSDMAIGLGRMFGFHFQENFDLPYISVSVREFWRRWHISLSSWFRDYLYIPLGGNRKGTLRTYLNLLIVFLATGLWHGAGWNFVLWGLYHGFFLILERTFPGKLLERCPRIIGHVYTLAEVFFGWILFRAASITDAVSFVKNMFLFHGGMADAALFDGKLALFLAAGILLAGPVPYLKKKMSVSESGTENKGEWNISLPSILGCMLILWYSVMLLINNTYNPFIYFRF